MAGVGSICTVDGGLPSGSITETRSGTFRGVSDGHKKITDIVSGVGGSMIDSAMSRARIMRCVCVRQTVFLNPTAVRAIHRPRQTVHFAALPIHGNACDRCLASAYPR